MHYVPRTKFSSHDACERRPFEACKIDAGDQLQFIDLKTDACDAEGSEMIRLLPNYTRANTACVELKLGLQEMIMRAIFSAICTVIQHYISCTVCFA